MIGKTIEYIYSKNLVLVYWKLGLKVKSKRHYICKVVVGCSSELTPVLKTTNRCCHCIEPSLGIDDTLLTKKKGVAEGVEYVRCTLCSLFLSQQLSQMGN